MGFFLFLLKLFIYMPHSKAFVNIVKNGDVQAYSNNTFLYSGVQVYRGFPSISNQWYNQNFANLQVKKRTDTPTTLCFQLATSLPITLCQNIKLRPAMKYQIKYSVFCIDMLQKMTIYAYLDSTKIAELYIHTSNTYGNKVAYFYSPLDEREHKLCFNQTHVPIPSLAGIWWTITIGALLDNISIFEADLRQISFYARINENFSKLFLISDFIYNETIANEFGKQYNLTTSGMTLEELNFIQNTNGFFQIQANVFFQFGDTQLQFVSSQNPNINEMLYFNIRIQYQSIYFHNLGEDFKILLISTQKILKEISKFVLTLANFLKFATCSYFIVTLLNFENLILFYVFLDIDTVPEFMKEVYYDLLRVHFEISSISKWLVKIGLVRENSLSLSIQTQKVREVVDIIKDNNKWFGWYQISSLVFNNNVDFFILFGMLIIKLKFVNIFVQCLSKRQRRSLDIEKSFNIVALIQFVTNVPSFMISSQSRILEATVVTGEMVEKSFQICLNFTCIVIGLLYIVLKKKKIYHNQVIKPFQIKDRSKIEKKDKIRPVKFKVKLMSQHKTPIPTYMTKIARKRKTIKLQISDFYNQFSDIIHIFTVSFLITFYSTKLFLVAQGFAVIFKMFCFICQKSNKGLIRKLIQFLINLVWIIQHIIFIIFYLLSCEPGDYLERNSKNSSLIIILGLSGLMTVAAGFCLQILKFAIALLNLLKKSLTILKKECGDNPVKSPKLQVHPKQEDKILKTNAQNIHRTIQDIQIYQPSNFSRKRHIYLEQKKMFSAKKNKKKQRIRVTKR